jgi:hypothetical protein
MFRPKQLIKLCASINTAAIFASVAASIACGRVGFLERRFEETDSNLDAFNIDSGIGADGATATADARPTCAGHDEDGDGYGDACDNCPTVANTDQLNVGEMPAAPDALGDVCDPRPSVVGDKILRVVYFDQPNLPAGFGGGSNYTLMNDALRIGTTTSGVSGLVFFAGDRNFTRMEARMTVSSGTNFAQWSGLWLHTAGSRSLTPGLSGQVAWNAGAPQLHSIINEFAGPGGTMQTLPPPQMDYPVAHGPLAANEEFVFTYDDTPAGLQLRLRGEQR